MPVKLHQRHVISGCSRSSLPPGTPPRPVALPPFMPACIAAARRLTPTLPCPVAPMQAATTACGWGRSSRTGATPCCTSWGGATSPLFGWSATSRCEVGTAGPALPGPSCHVGSTAAEAQMQPCSSGWHAAWHVGGCCCSALCLLDGSCGGFPAARVDSSPSRPHCCRNAAPLQTGGLGAMKVVKSAAHYTEAARDEITLLSQIAERDPGQACAEGFPVLTCLLCMAGTHDGYMESTQLACFFATFSRRADADPLFPSRRRGPPLLLPHD